MITGASRGIGYHAALGLASEGAHIIAVARTVGGLEELDDEIKKRGGSATLVPLDLCDFDALDRLGETIESRWGKLDILIGNAAVLGDITPLPMLAPEIFHSVFSINVVANYRLIRSLDSLLRASDCGRGVFITSGIAGVAKAYVGAYASSKAALESLVKCYVEEIRNTSLRVNLLDPGIVRTKMRASYAPGEDPDSIDSPAILVPSILSMCSDDINYNGNIYRFLTKSWDC